MNEQTGEIENEAGELNVATVTHTRRKDGSLRIQFGYDNCPSMAEQHTAHLSDINYLISKYKPDELTAYLAARAQHKQEIVGHDFTKEPNLQEANNILYKLKKDFAALPEEVTSQFKNHVEFLKFIDNPANAQKMVKLGLLTVKQIQQQTDPTKTNDDSNDNKKSDPKSKSKTKSEDT